MTRLWLSVALLAFSAGCVRTRAETRIERGATLRSWERQGTPAPGGVRAEVALQWPTATITFQRFDLCPVEQVEEYEEQRITYRSSNSGVASLGMGVTTALIGGGLLLALPVFSNAPDTDNIDAAGRYGPSSRQYARGFGITLLVVGVPTVAAAAWELAGTGEKVERTRREQVLTREPVRCNPRPAEGAAELLATRGPVAGVRQEGAVLQVPAEILRGVSVSGATVAGEDVTIDAADWDRLLAFQSCAQASPPPEGEGLIALEPGALRARLDAARACDEVPGAPGAEWVQSLERELQGRRGSEAGVAPGPRIESFDEALATWPPALTIPQQAAVDALAEPEKLKGVAVRVRGQLVDFLEANIAVLEVQGRQLWLYLDASRPWSTEVRVGAELEVLGLVMGRQEVGKLEAPLLRVLWARRAPPSTP